MSHANFTPTQEQLDYLHTTPKESPSPAKPTAYSKRLESLGLHAKADRAKDDGHWWQWYKVEGSAPFRRPCSNSMLRSTPHYASELAKNQYIKYQRFEELISNVFSTITIYLNARKFSEGKELISEIRDIIDQVLPGTLDKIGYLGGWAIKVIFRSSINAELLSTLQAALPEGVTCSRKNHHKEDFKKLLKDFVAPDLPPTPEGQADFEYLLEDLHQITARKLSKADRSKFVLGDFPYTNLDDEEVVVVHDKGRPCTKCGQVHYDRRPLDPRTKQPATHIYGQIVGETFRITDFQPEYWIRLPECSAQGSQRAA